MAQRPLKLRQASAYFEAVRLLAARVSYATAGHPDPRVRVAVRFTENSGRTETTGYLDTDLWGGNHFEIAEHGVRSIFRWDEVERIVVLRPSGKAE